MDKIKCIYCNKMLKTGGGVVATETGEFDANECQIPEPYETDFYHIDCYRKFVKAKAKEEIDAQEGDMNKPNDWSITKKKAIELKRIVKCLVKDAGELRYPGCGGCNDQGLCYKIYSLVK